MESIWLNKVFFSQFQRAINYSFKSKESKSQAEI